jgi:hypothetical protein
MLVIGMKNFIDLE